MVNGKRYRAGNGGIPAFRPSLAYHVGIVRAYFSSYSIIYTCALSSSPHSDYATPITERLPLNHLCPSSNPLRRFTHSTFTVTGMEMQDSDQTTGPSPSSGINGNEAEHWCWRGTSSQNTGNRGVLDVAKSIWQE